MVIKRASLYYLYMSNFWKTLPKPFTVLAPMEGVTDYVFREIISEIGKPNVLFTEFTSADALDIPGFENTITRLKFTQKQRPKFAQLWGVNPAKLYNATKIVYGMGFDGVDINMGCPDKAVVKKGAGAGLIKNRNLVTEILTAVSEAKQDMAMSVKTRVGFDLKITTDWIGFLLTHKLDALTVHGRTAKELSNTQADWEEIYEAVLLRDQISPDTLIIGNGDGKSIKEVEQKHKEYKVDGVMIGRGIFSDPFLFDKVRQDHDTKEHLKILLEHSALYNDYYHGTRNYAEMRRFFKIYVRNFKGATKLIDQLMKCQNHEEVKMLIDKFTL